MNRRTFFGALAAAAAAPFVGWRTAKPRTAKPRFATGGVVRGRLGVFGRECGSETILPITTWGTNETTGEWTFTVSAEQRPGVFGGKP